MSEGNGLDEQAVTVIASSTPPSEPTEACLSWEDVTEGTGPQYYQEERTGTIHGDRVTS